MNFDSLLRSFLSSPTYQRLFMAFTVGLFLSCAARVSDAQPSVPGHGTNAAASVGAASAGATPGDAAR